MSSETVFTKENLDYCLRELGKEFRKLNGKTMPAEIILIGGASVLANYGFRDATYDLDAFIQASSVMEINWDFPMDGLILILFGQNHILRICEHILFTTRLFPMF